MLNNCKIVFYFPDKQASDDEDNEIEIVEPKTDTITIDSDNEEETPSTSKPAAPKGLQITSVKSVVDTTDFLQADPVTAKIDPNADLDVAAFSSSILASLLEVDITEGSSEVKKHQSVSPEGSTTKKQPRKKTTNKPNPALINLNRQRMEEIKRNDAKLQMKVVVKLRRVEEDFEVARKWFANQKDLDSVKAKEQKSEESKVKSSENQDNIGNNEDCTPEAINKKCAEREEEIETPTGHQTVEEDMDITENKGDPVHRDINCTDIEETETHINIIKSREPLNIIDEVEHVERVNPEEEVMEGLETNEISRKSVDESLTETLPIEGNLTDNTESEEKSDSNKQADTEVEVAKSDSVIEKRNDLNESGNTASNTDSVAPAADETTSQADDAGSTKTDSDVSKTKADDAITPDAEIDDADDEAQPTPPQTILEADDQEDQTSKVSPVKPDAEQPADTESSPGKPPTSSSADTASLPQTEDDAV